MSIFQASQIIADTISNYCVYSTIALFLYDSVITTANEVHCFWGRKLTGAAVLFWLNKYIAMLYFVWGLTTSFNSPLKVPAGDYSYLIAEQASLAIAQLLFLVWAALAGIRVYGLRKNWIISAAVFLLSAAPAGVNFSAYLYGFVAQDVPLLGGVVSDSSPLTIVKLSCLIASDCLVISATWFALSRRYNTRDIGERRGTISGVLLLDGEHHLEILALLNSLHFMFTMLSLDIVAFQNVSYITAFTTPLSTVLVSRFLLHLQSANLRSIDMSSSQPTTSQESSVVFERVVGSLGATILPNDYFVEEDYAGDLGYRNSVEA
ncbi:hypothetical protein BD309DRAFT_959745 [Dichomitus squalens]|uniref:Uncharacterized protein n=1 Tax=Dichomitus squalens TaxID=114155 RepID=A0A4Q9NSR2_9APHY|nr:hypothetical protein BD309DRAFT_959745 [Dichomitus squalens]TBU61780.1 hypothetical protein BD310DRAFT_919867 [Dichomitus squalens]